VALCTHILVLLLATSARESPRTDKGRRCSSESEKELVQDDEDEYVRESACDIRL